MSQRHLRSIEVDAETGEVVEACAHVRGCGHCQDREHELEQLRRKYGGLLSEIGRLKSDPDEEARRHKLWAEAQAVFDWWGLACHHERAEFTPDRFWEVLPRLKERGPVGVLKVIAALAYDPNKSAMRNGRTKLHDGWHLICESGPKCDERIERVPGGAESEAWKRWLVDRIESSLKGDSDA